jgi:mannan endo-1,4-beta-mannosidase
VLRRLVIGFALVAVSAATLHAAGASHANATSAAASTRRHVYWGAYAAGGQYGLVDAPWNMKSADRFEANAGKRMSLLEWGQAWRECSDTCGPRGFRSDLMSRARRRGYLPVLSWGSYAAGEGPDQPEYQLADIIEGRYDGFIRAWARGAKAWGHPFFLRFDWEMNTNSVPYSEHANGNRPGEFVRMWRHVHDIFEAVGATNATWTWCPNVEYASSVKPLASLYPGAAYVDWTCLDGYNWGTNPAHPDAWRSFGDVFGATYRLVTRRIAPSKRLMIGEMGSTEIGGSKARWIADALGRQVTSRFPRIRAVIWFNKRWDGMDWPIESSPGAVQALRAAIRSPVYVANRFAHADTSPIGP